MANPKLRAEARRLRIEEGLSMIEICEQLNLAKSTVSGWLKDLPLTPEQLEVVKKRRGRDYHGRAAGGLAVKAKFRKLREQYQQEGREKAKEFDPLHIAGCMLYWAEGAKSRNTLQFTNSDEAMMILFMRFLRECMGIDNTRIKIRITCYLGNGLSLEEIEHYWMGLLGLPHECLGKSVVNVAPISSNQRGRKLLYGMCEIAISVTQLIQHVFGAIQEYSGIDKPEWLL